MQKDDFDAFGLFSCSFESARFAQRMIRERDKFPGNWRLAARAMRCAVSSLNLGLTFMEIEQVEAERAAKKKAFNPLLI